MGDTLPNSPFFMRARLMTENSWKRLDCSVSPICGGILGTMFASFHVCPTSGLSMIRHEVTHLVGRIGLSTLTVGAA